MKSSDKVDKEKVQLLYQHFLHVVEGTLNTIDQIAKLNTYKLSDRKVINSSQFRLHLRKVKMQLLKDLTTGEPIPPEPPEPTNAA